MSGVKLGGCESDLTIPECGLAIMTLRKRSSVVPLTGGTQIDLAPALSMDGSCLGRFFRAREVPHHECEPAESGPSDILRSILRSVR